VTKQNRIQIERIAAQITEYLARNPLAADTLAGIQSWWLSGAPAEISSIQVETAIHLLLERRTLQCNALPDGTKTYSRAEPATSQTVDQCAG
jgi:hypothetical protein